MNFSTSLKRSDIIKLYDYSKSKFLVLKDVTNVKLEKSAQIKRNKDIELDLTSKQKLFETNLIKRHRFEDEDNYYNPLAEKKSEF